MSGRERETKRGGRDKVSERKGGKRGRQRSREKWVECGGESGRCRIESEETSWEG
jgi:hypothetical protein